MQFRPHVGHQPPKRAVPHITTGQQTSPGRRALRGGGIGIAEDHAFPCHAVDVRCRKLFLSKMADIPVGEVIGENENDIGWLCIFTFSEQ